MTLKEIMTYIFKTVLNTEDYVTYHLFQASTSPVLKKRRFKHWFVIPVVYFITGYILKELGRPQYLQWIFYLTGVIWLIAYPFYSTWAVKRFITRQVKSKYKDLLEKEGTLTVSENNISLKNEKDSMKIKFNEVLAIHEIPTHFLVELQNGFSLILPKKNEKDGNLTSCIQTISNKSKIEITNDLNWKWA